MRNTKPAGNLMGHYYSPLLEMRQFKTRPNVIPQEFKI